MSTLEFGEVIASFGRQYLVRADDARTIECVPRGKRSELACGDRVAFEISGDRGVIERFEPRTSLYARASVHRTKLIAANATQVVVVVALEPSWSDELVCRAIVAAEHARLSVLIVLNKCDLAGIEPARARVAPFRRAGHRVLELVARIDVAPLRSHLSGERSVLLGQSGMGKSTIINRLLPDANAQVAEISHFLDSGRHTTSAARLYRLDDATMVIDSPGLQEFGLAHLSRGDIERGFIELAPLLGRCRFNDCRHRSEPGCAVRVELDAGGVDPRRYALLMRILDAEAR